MGATNVIAAYQLYAGRIPATSMQLLAYMACISRDHDDRPWFSLGHEALAVHALGRQAPAGRADYAAVERAITPLLSIGAITADRRAANRREGGKTVKYRLHLVPSAHREIDEPPVDEPPGGHPGRTERPTESVTDAPRKSCRRPTVSVQTPHGNRGTEEYEEYEEREQENHLDHEGESPGPEPRAARANNPEIPDDTCAHCGTLIDPDRQCRNRDCPGAGLAAIIPLRRPA